MAEVSVIIPFYNGEKYICETIESVLGQTYKDYEIIIVDDGSSNGSAAEMLSRFKNDIHYLRQENSGISAARNKAISMATGKFIAFIDHDDKWLPEKLDAQMNLFKKDPALGLVYSDSYIIAKTGSRRGTIFSIAHPRRGHVFHELLKVNFIPILTVIVKKSALEDVGYFNRDFFLAEDWDLFLRISKKYPIDYVDAPLAEYRVHPESYSKNRIPLFQEMNSIIESYLNDKASVVDKSEKRELGLILRRQKLSLILARLNKLSLNPLSRYIDTDGMHSDMYDAFPFKKKIKVLYVIDSSRVGGAEYYVASLSKYIDKEKFETIIVCPSGGAMVALYNKCAGRVYALDVKTFFELKAIQSVAAIIKTESVDIVHSVLFSSDFCAAMASGIRGTVFISSVVGFNFSYTGNGRLEHFKKSVQSFCYRLAYIPARRVIAVAEAVKYDLFSRPGIKVNLRKVTTAHCGIPDMTIYDFGSIRKRYAIKDAEKIISCVAALNQGKGLIYLLRAAQLIINRFNNIKFLLVGEGPERQELENEVVRLSIGKNVIFTGPLTEDDKNAVIRLSDIFILPSLSEGCPLVVLEAMALGKAVVATNVGGIPELVKNGESGLLVAPKDSITLANAVIALLSDDLLAAKMGKKGREIYERNFTVETMVKSISDMYITFLENGRAIKKGSV